MGKGIAAGLNSVKNAVRAKFARRDQAEPDHPSEKTSPRGKGKKSRVIVAIFCLLIFLIAAVLILDRRAETGKFSLPFDATTVLAYTDFSNSISATGTVESAASTFVYSTLTAMVEDVYVELGDAVEEGQLLAKLDDRRIADQIESQEAGLKVSAAGSEQAIKAARDSYAQFKEALEKGLNPSLNSAEAQVDAAYENYTRALKTYERYRETLDAGENTTLLSQESARRNARLALDAAEDVLAGIRARVIEACNQLAAAENELAGLEKLFESGSGEDPAELEERIAEAEAEVAEKKTAYDKALSDQAKAEGELEKAKQNYDLARAQYNAAVTNADNMLADYADAVDSAERAYREALKNREAALLAAENQLQSYANSLHSATINADNSVARVGLNQLRVELNSTNITAPVAGTVTAVYAMVGSSGSGLLFVIEDVHDLIIETTVKEYDIGTVAAGMPVSIKSNATGSDVYAGEILSIAPTARKTAQGLTDPSGDGEFAAKVKVTSSDTRLRIGMSVRLNYIIEQQEKVLSVPYDAVYLNSAGEQCILILEERPGDAYLLQELAVTPELENDLAIAISGSDLSAGLRVLNEPDDYQHLVGREVTLISRSAPARSPFFGG